MKNKPTRNPKMRGYWLANLISLGISLGTLMFFVAVICFVVIGAMFGLGHLINFILEVFL